MGFSVHYGQLSFAYMDTESELAQRWSYDLNLWLFSILNPITIYLAHARLELIWAQILGVIIFAIRAPAASPDYTNKLIVWESEQTGCLSQN